MATSSAPSEGATAPVVGIDPGPVTEWFCEHVDGVAAPLSFALIAGGRSNLTYRVTDAAGRAFALRRPPVSHVLPTAHDMRREYKVMTALGPTPVPVPETYGLCVDESVNERPFYVMNFVEGHILRDEATASAAFAESERHAIGLNLAETLAGLHAVDIEAVGLADLGRHEGYIERQLRRWTGQYQDMKVEGVDHGGLVEEVGAALAANVPDQQGTAIVHGDYRLDNTVLGDDGRVAAILDWEICTLGAPMADIGLLLVYWSDPGDARSALIGVSPTTAPGFASRAELLERYAQVSGRDVSHINYYMAFGYWKLACIIQGVYARYLAGAGAGDTNSVDAFPQQVAVLAETAATTLAAQ